MEKLFDLKEILKKTSGKSTMIIIFVVVILLSIVASSSPEENDINMIDDSAIISDNNIVLENDEISNQNKIEEDKTTEDKIEEVVDLSKLKNDELAKIQEYSNSSYCIINNNIPFFYDTDLVTDSYEIYSSLDNFRKMW